MEDLIPIWFARPKLTNTHFHVPTPHPYSQGWIHSTIYSNGANMYLKPTTMRITYSLNEKLKHRVVRLGTMQ